MQKLTALSLSEPTINNQTLSRKQLIRLSCLEQENSFEAKRLSVENIKEFIVGQQQENTESEPWRKQRKT